ncbi:MAG: LysM peptidoglycan-binding domain-containing protein [Bacteroidetes bacterium]|nr:LysM peptidoglycan-binding domain-containing protein [Bacteroidota bacterium]
MDANTIESAKNKYLGQVIKVVAVVAILLFPLISKAQVSGNFFFSLMDSLEASPLMEWVQFDEKSLKSAKAYHIENKPPLRMLIESGFSMPADNDVNDFISGLVKRKKASALMFALAKENFKISEQKLNAEKLPLIFKYLPVALSAMDSKAEWAKGAGIWHCYFPQAVKYGLKLSDGQDERFHPSKSSEAAIKHLKNIYVANKNNASETILIYVFGKNYKTSQNLMAAGYTPDSFIQAFTSLAYIIEAKLLPVFSEAGISYPAITEIKVEKLAHLNFQNKKYPFNAKQLSYLNPIFVSGTIPAGSIVKTVSTDADNFTNWLNSEEREIKEVESVEKISHRIRSGENLGLIANKYNVSISDLKEWNNLRSDLIREGQVLIIYKK